MSVFSFLPDDSAKPSLVSRKTALTHIPMKILRQKIYREAIILPKMSAQAPILAMFFLGIKIRETDLLHMLMTFHVLKGLSRRIDFTTTPTHLSIATTLEKASNSGSRDRHSQHTFPWQDQ